MKTARFNRRELLENCIVKGLLIAGVPMSSTHLLAMWQKAEDAARKPTPSDVLGPYFKEGAKNVANMRNAGDPGVTLKVTGDIFNTRGEKVEGAKLDLWHADHKGDYDNTGFRYRSKIEAHSANYEVATVIPGHYAQRPAQHIHYKITAPGHKTLVTQLYFATDPFFEGDLDKNHKKRSIVGNRDLIRPVTLYEKPDALFAAVRFDICLEKA